MRTFVLVCLAAALFAAACGPSPRGDDDDGSNPDGGQPSTQCDDPGATEACYTGTIGTDGVGPCHGGTRTCGDSGHWSACEGEVTPATDVCGNGQDEDCDGTADNPTDEDGDGFTNCDGDCCDSTDEGCMQPERVNPGAIEVDGNTLDDDCDGNVDNATAQPLCDSGLTSNSSNAMDYAKAMDLCEETTATDPHWGVISAKFLYADGTGSPVAAQRAIRPEFGATQVQNGTSMAVISTAAAAATGQTNPAPSPWQSTPHGTSSGYPEDWYQANDEHLPNAPGCPEPLSLFGEANDPIMLELKIRTPTNASSFSMRVNFMSAEFPEYTCSSFNDFFVVLLDSGWTGTPANPTDKNLAFYANPGGQHYPVGVNLAHGNTGLFQVCRNGQTGCAGNAGNINTCASDAELANTGLEEVDGSCGSNAQVGGGTGWLTTSGNVNGGEVITIRIALWDTSDGAYDSVAMIDNFQWSLTPSEPGTVIDVD